MTYDEKENNTYEVDEQFMYAMNVNETAFRMLVICTFMVDGAGAVS